MHASPKLVLDLGQLRPHPLRDGLALQPEPSVLGLPAGVREAEEVERLAFPDATGCSCPGSIAPELDESRLVGVQLQTELRPPLTKVGKELLRIGLMLESGHKVISKTNDDDVTVGILPSPLPDPPVKDVVEVDVGQQRGNDSSNAMDNPRPERAGGRYRVTDHDTLG